MKRMVTSFYLACNTIKSLSGNSPPLMEKNNKSKGARIVQKETSGTKGTIPFYFTKPAARLGGKQIAFKQTPYVLVI
jgi:hypothetical protein